MPSAARSKTKSGRFTTIVEPTTALAVITPASHAPGPRSPAACRAQISPGRDVRPRRPLACQAQIFRSGVTIRAISTATAAAMNMTTD
jgi:hypothetical protein